MATNMKIPSQQASKVRNYGSFAGVDFSSNPSMVALNRSPDAKNVYKNYNDTMGQAVETRPGLISLGDLGSKIYGIHIIGSKCLVHYGIHLAWWENFPSEIESSDNLTVLSSSMAQRDSVSFISNKKLYMMDGTNYWVYDATLPTQLKAVSENSFIPTTRIGADPNGGNGMSYQAVNLLQSKRKNSFVGNGTANYYLDTTGLDAVGTYAVQAWVNGVLKSENTHFTVDRNAGKVTFTAGNYPSAPTTPGQDNVIIQFSKNFSEPSYINKIKNCTIARIFDNRVFVSGNPNYAGTLFHSELNDPTYFADTSYYIDGDDGANITALIQGQGVLLALKEDRVFGSKVYIHTPTMVYTDAADANSEIKAYPRIETEIMLGGSSGINFMDDIVFISPMGLEAIRLSSDTSLEHRSTLVDTKFTTEANFRNCKMQIWNNYLMILINGKIYLADSRQKYAGAQSMEYEWYCWDKIGINEEGILYPAYLLKEHEGELYFGCENGQLGKFYGTNDCGVPIESYWTTPPDNFGTLSRFKNIMKRGGVAEVKRIPNSLIKVDIKTDKQSYTKIFEGRTDGFKFTNFTFVGLHFGTGTKGMIIYQPKRKKIKELSLKFYSDEIDKPFGVYDTSIEVEIQNHVKE